MLMSYTEWVPGYSKCLCVFNKYDTNLALLDFQNALSWFSKTANVELVCASFADIVN